MKYAQYATILGFTAAAPIAVGEECKLTDKLSDCEYNLLCMGEMPIPDDTEGKKVSLCVPVAQCDADMKPKNADYTPPADTTHANAKFVTEGATCSKPSAKGVSGNVCTVDWMCDDAATPKLRCGDL